MAGIRRGEECLIWPAQNHKQNNNKPILLCTGGACLTLKSSPLQVKLISTFVSISTPCQVGPVADGPKGKRRQASLVFDFDR